MPPKAEESQLPEITLPFGTARGGIHGYAAAIGDTLGTARSGSKTARSGGDTARSGGERVPTSARPIIIPEAPKYGAGVTMPVLMSFVFPPTQEHPESLGRLELFARYGPTDEEGQQRGGISGSHTHTETEIHKMIAYNITEAFYSLYKRPRSECEVLVENILPIALDEFVTKSEIRKLLANVPRDANARMTFGVLQDVVLENQKKRLLAIMKNYSIRGKKEREPKVPYQNKQADALLAITRMKKMNVPQESLAQGKRLHAYSTHLALLEDCHAKAAQINMNVALCRHRGDVDDKWNRYCCVRKQGRSGYVSARNHPRACDLDVADRHPGVSSLTATMS